MAIPDVRMETHSNIAPTLRLAGGNYTVTAGRVTVPLTQVAEAITKGWVLSDPAVRFPPPKFAMCPPSPLTVVYGTPQADPIPIQGPQYSGALINTYPNNATPMEPPGSGGGRAAPAIGACR